MTAPIKIGEYTVAGGILAPMAGYTDVAFRELCAELGAGLTVTEMVSARGLVHGNAATAELMRVSPREKITCVQLFGSDPRDFEAAAKKIEADIIDVNMGCPMPKITKNGDGASLLTDPVRAAEIVKALKSSTDKPITVKTRLGYKTGSLDGLELVRRVAEAGASAVAVHCRYAEQRYAGKADYSAGEKIAKSVDIPVIVNGDIAELGSVPPFAGVMIGRAALSNPAVFCGGKAEPTEIARKHIGLLLRYFDERYTVIAARKFFVHYFKGVRGGKALRDDVNRAECVADVLLALDKFENNRYKTEV